MTRWHLILPVLVCAGIVAVLAVRLTTPEPSPTAGVATDRAIPTFAATPLLPDLPGFSHADLGERFVLVNVFASWCAPCLIEHPHLMALRDHLLIYGIAFGDKADAVQRMLADKGNPFARINDDPNGTQSIGWGVRGVPESFLVSPQGRIVWHFAGPLTDTQTDAILAHLGKTHPDRGLFDRTRP